MHELRRLIAGVFVIALLLLFLTRAIDAAPRVDSVP